METKSIDELYNKNPEFYDKQLVKSFDRNAMELEQWDGGELTPSEIHSCFSLVSLMYFNSFRSLITSNDEKENPNKLIKEPADVIIQAKHRKNLLDEPVIDQSAQKSIIKTKKAKNKDRYVSHKEFTNTIYPQVIGICFTIMFITITIVAILTGHLKPNISGF